MGMVLCKRLQHGFGNGCFLMVYARFWWLHTMFMLRLQTDLKTYTIGPSSCSISQLSGAAESSLPFSQSGKVIICFGYNCQNLFLYFACSIGLCRSCLLQVGGTILAAKLAKERGWAVNVGGGFHHCSGEKGGGFCAYADISLCIHYAFVRLNISRYQELPFNMQPL